jgi:hypothetical protein
MLFALLRRVMQIKGSSGIKTRKIFAPTGLSPLSLPAVRYTFDIGLEQARKYG